MGVTSTRLLYLLATPRPLLRALANIVLCFLLLLHLLLFLMSRCLEITRAANLGNFPVKLVI